jgi:proline iminopeptidase
MFPPIESAQSGMLRVSSLHTVYWETVGDVRATPILFLHGGPGGGCTARHRQFFDSATAYVTLFDQRGCGRSTPLGEVVENTTQDLIEDIERLRKHLRIERWLVFGGSWGSTLALAYGQAHPERCLGFILRGIFLGTKSEIAWFLHGMGGFFPQEHEAWLSALTPEERAAPLRPYLRRMLDDHNPAAQLAATKAWARYEAACASLTRKTTTLHDDAHSGFALARLEAHYMANDCFLEPDQLLTHLHRIEHLPATIIHGRYDVICQPKIAFTLAKKWARAKLHIVEAAGHSAHEPGIENALVASTQQMLSELTAQKNPA